MCIEIGIVGGQVITKSLRAIVKRMSSDQGEKRDCTGYESLQPLSTSDYQAITRETERETVMSRLLGAIAWS